MDLHRSLAANLYAPLCSGEHGAPIWHRGPFAVNPASTSQQPQRLLHAFILLHRAVGNGLENLADLVAPLFFGALSPFPIRFCVVLVMVDPMFDHFDQLFAVRETSVGVSFPRMMGVMRMMVVVRMVRIMRVMFAHKWVPFMVAD